MVGLQLLAAGCAPGYYERSAANQEPYYQSQHFYNDSDTWGDYQMRVWQEEKGR
jgi:hypothetical protein